MVGGFLSLFVQHRHLPVLLVLCTAQVREATSTNLAEVALLASYKLCHQRDQGVDIIRPAMQAAPVSMY